MSRYRPLFSISVRHGFFPGSLCDVLDLLATPESSALARNVGLVVKRMGDRTGVYCDENQMDALRLAASDGESPLRLVFRVVSRDPLFDVYTEPPPFRDDRILSFQGRTRPASSAEGNVVRLHTAEQVSEEDFAELGSEQFAGIAMGSDQRSRTLAVVTIHLTDEGGALAEPGGEAQPPEFRIAFRARRTIWRYYLLDDLAGRDSYITDLDRGVEFEYSGEASLPGDRTAIAFRSKTPLPLRQRSDFRFQLREKGGESGNGNGRVLIKRLPVASARRIYRATIDGAYAIVSDIYVNG